MAKSTLNLNKLKEEIDKRKSEGISEGFTPKGRDNFLDQLKRSFDTGRETESTHKIKTIANKASDKIQEKYGVSEKKPFSSVKEPIPEQPRQRAIITDDDGVDRENKLFESFHSANKQTLAQALESQIGGGRNQQGGSQNFPTQINEQALVNKIDERLNNYLVENIGEIFNDSIKNVILEHFTKEKIKEVILENNDLIRESVINVIRELQKKKKTS
jgi:hypothetical protein